MRLLIFILFSSFSSLCWADAAAAAEDKRACRYDSGVSAGRTVFKFLGKTDTQGGEAKRNDNVSFDLVDNNALKEQNSRLGTSATLIQEFLPQHSYFGAESATRLRRCCIFPP